MGLRDRLLGKRSPEDEFTADVSAAAKELFPAAGIEPVETLTLDVTWKEAEQVVPDLLAPVPDLDPPRRHVGAWPDDERLARLREIAAGRA